MIVIVGRMINSNTHITKLLNIIKGFCKISKYICLYNAHMYHYVHNTHNTHDTHNIHLMNIHTLRL